MPETLESLSCKNTMIFEDLDTWILDPIRFLLDKAIDEVCCGAAESQEAQVQALQEVEMFLRLALDRAQDGGQVLERLAVEARGSSAKEKAPEGAEESEGPRRGRPKKEGGKQ